MSNPKVFEFAKEVGMTPLALMDKIREWHLPVKSHMAELDSGTLEAIKAKLKEPKSAEPGAEKKPAARKKAAEPQTAAAKAPASKAAPKSKAALSKPPTRPVTKATSAAAAAAAVAAKPAASTVVRRKKTVEEVATKEAEAIEAAPEMVEETETEQVETPIEPQTSHTLVAPAATIEASPVIPAEVKELAAISAATAPIAASPISTPAPATAVAATPAAAPVSTAANAPAAIILTSQVGTSVNPADEGHERKTIPSRKKEVAIGNSGVASQPARRNIIGRMDLSRVQNQHQSSTPGGPPRGDRPVIGGPRPPLSRGPGGPRPAGNLRTGFIQQAAPIPDLGPVGEFDRKKDDRRRAKPGGAPSEGGPAKTAEEEAAVKHFDAAEFRKREMVFQPKKKKGMLSRPAMQTQITKPKASKRVIKVNQTMKVGDLANEMGIKTPELIRKLVKDGVMATINSDLDFDTISLIVTEFGFEAQNAFKSAETMISETTTGDRSDDTMIRPPVVTIMGHVDHGKTSLLDVIRNTNVAGGEAGGITQHIGAYQVTTEDGHVVTFLDTPGHEAFTAMRARGANCTDIAVIVVAADDGVMPQTAEAISHAKAAKVPMIVAINKMDKPGANPDKIKQQLTEYEVVPEEWGGTTIFVGVSALKKTGIKELLEQIHLLAEVAELKANPKKSGTGVVIESRLEKGRGNVATLLVQDGTVKVGQDIVAGTVIGRVRSMTNYKGEKVLEALPGMPVEVLGLNGTPQAGDKFDIVKDDRVAESVMRVRQEQALRAIGPQAKISLEDIFAKVKKGDVKELGVILKTDMTGSLEAIRGMLAKLVTPEVKLKVIHSAVGGITENDILLASTSKGIVVGFNVRPDGGANAAAKRMGVDVRTYSIVYEMIDDLKKAMSGLLTPDIVERVLGRAEVRNTFNVPKIGTIAGSLVSDGKIQRSNMARLIRDGKIIFEGKISSLKRFKDDAREVAQGFECGIGIENFNDVKVGDVIEAFVKEEVARELSAMSPTP